MIFNPDPPGEPSRGGVGPGLCINHYAPHFAQKLTSHKNEVVVLLIKRRIQHQHAGDARGLQRLREQADQLGLTFRTGSRSATKAIPPGPLARSSRRRKYWSRIGLALSSESAFMLCT